MASDTKLEDIGRAKTISDVKVAKSNEPPTPAVQSSQITDAPIRKPSSARKPDIRPSTSNPVPRVMPGTVETIGGMNLKNNITEAKAKGLQLGGAEGEKQKEEAAKVKGTTNPQDASIIK